MMPLNDTTKGELYALTQGMLWGLFPVITVVMYAYIGSLYAAAFCTLISAVFFAFLLTVRRRWKELLVRAAWLPILIASLLIGVIFYGLLFTALRYSTAGNISIISQMEIFFSFLILDVMLHQEKNTKKHIIGAAFMVIGVWIVLSSGVSAWNVGDAIMLLATAIPPVGNLFAKRARTYVSAECLMFVRSLIGGGFLLAVALYQEPFPSGEELRMSIGLLLFSGIFLFGVRTWLWIEAIHRITIARTISLASISPLFALIFAYFILGDAITFRQIVGIIPMLLGVYLLTRTERRNSTPFVSQFP